MQNPANDRITSINQEPQDRNSKNEPFDIDEAYNAAINFINEIWNEYDESRETDRL